MPDKNLKIEVAIQCHFFQRRLCWMLSSILQQEGDLPGISVSVSCLKNNGDPTTEKVAELFRQAGLDIRLCVHPDIKTFQFRGLNRNRQLDETKADWLLYADSDMVYPVDFFSTLKKLLGEEPYVSSCRCLHSGRSSIRKAKATDEMINQFKYPCVVPRAFRIASTLRCHNVPNVGAGYCQIVNVERLRTRDGFYVNPKRCRDWSWEKRYQRARSDLQFRRRVGRMAIPLPNQLHLQHIRDCTEGHHVEVQR